MTYEKNLIDDIGEIRPRKNEYIIDSIKAEENGGSKVDAKNHPYNQKLKKYEEEAYNQLKASFDSMMANFSK